MQGLVLQLTRAGFLMLLWLFIWSVLRILRTDIYAPTGAVMVRRGLTLRGTLLPARQRGGAARYLVVTEGALSGARITLSGQPGFLLEYLGAPYLAGTIEVRDGRIAAIEWIRNPDKLPAG